MSNRPGIALIFTILVLAVLAAAGAGIFALGARETEIAVTLAHRATATSAAESAVRAVVDGWSTRQHRVLTPGQSHAMDSGMLPGHGISPPGVELAVVVARLDDRLFLVTAAAHAVAGLPTTARAAALVRTFDPAAMAHAFNAAVGADDIVVDPAAVVDDAEDEVTEGAAYVLTPDPFSIPLLNELVSVNFENATVTPGPWTGPDGCEPRPSNWGAIWSSHPCHDLLPFVWSGADLTVRGGEGRGLLVVDGDLHIDGLRFEGVIQVSGRVTVTGPAVIRGAVRAGSADILEGTLIYDPVAVTAAFSAGGLDRALRPSDRWWVPVF